MALHDYNQFGGTSQSVITAYHEQMADIDRQLYETGKYTGPVPDAKTGEVTEQTLNARQAQALKRKLWNKADELEGYAFSDRHTKTKIGGIFAWLVDKIKCLNPFYLIRKMRAAKLYEQASNNVYQQEALYATAKAMAANNRENNEEVEPPKKEQSPREYTKEAPQKEPVKKEKQVTKEQPETKEQQEQAKTQTEPADQTPQQPVEEKKPLTKEEKAKMYHDKLYDAVEQEMREQGLTKEEVMIQLVSEQPLKILNIEQQDITPKLAAHAILAYSKVKNITPNAAVAKLARDVPAIVSADTRLDHSLDTIYKAIPNAIAKNPQTLKYLTEKQINSKTVEYTLADIHNGKIYKTPQEQEQCIAELKTVESAAATKFRLFAPEIFEVETPTMPEQPIAPTQPETPVAPEQIPPSAPTIPSENPIPTAPTAPIPPTVPTAPTAPILPNPEPVAVPETEDRVAKAMAIVEEKYPELECFPAIERERAAYTYMVVEFPDLYQDIPSSIVNLEMTAIAILADPDTLMIAPFDINDICSAVKELAWAQDIDVLRDFIDEVDHPTSEEAFRNEDTAAIRSVVMDVIDAKEYELTQNNTIPPQQQSDDMVI